MIPGFPIICEVSFGIIFLSAQTISIATDTLQQLSYDGEYPRAQTPLFPCFYHRVHDPHVTGTAPQDFDITVHEEQSFLCITFPISCFVLKSEKA